MVVAAVVYVPCRLIGVELLLVEGGGVGGRRGGRGCNVMLECMRFTCSVGLVRCENIGIFATPMTEDRDRPKVLLGQRSLWHGPLPIAAQRH